MSQSDYQREQLEALTLVRHGFAGPLYAQKADLLHRIDAYLQFRKDVDAFFQSYFNHICTRNCYEQRLSACCSKDGIITFFADVVINALLSEEQELLDLTALLVKPHTGFKCVYLGPEGCTWRLKPLVCAMFLCDAAQKEVFDENPEAAKDWKTLQQQEKGFRYPDRPVLFDDLERIFMDAGCQSSLMYLHNSPGLLRVKQQAGLLPKKCKRSQGTAFAALPGT